MAVEDRNCFIGKTIDNQLYTILQKMVEKGYAEDIPSRECFNELTLDSQLYLVYAALKRELWTPTQIPTIFWYDASDLSTITAIGNQVTQMLDKSGNGWTVAPLSAGKIGPDTGTRTLNGLNVLEFSKTTGSTNQILENDLFNQPQPFSIATVLRFDTDALADQDFLFSGTETANPRISVRRTTINVLQILTQAGAFSTPAIVTEGNDYIALFRFNTGSSTIRVNGSLSATGTIPNNSFTSLNIGGNFQEDQALNGFIAELVAFTSPADQTTIEGYLAWKWGLVAKLPAGHPYKNFPPKV
jgi:hypothetical protein